MDSRISDDRRARLRDTLVQGGADGATLARFDAVLSRRRFVSVVGKGGALAALATLGASDLAARGLLGRGLLPAAWAQDPKTIPGKPGMIVHNARPINGEFPAHMLDDAVTPSATSNTPMCAT